LVELKEESLDEYGAETVVRACIAAMRGRWHPISFDYEALTIATRLGCAAPGWIVCRFTAEVRAAAIALRVRWLITNKMFLRPGPLPEGPWEWMVYEIATPGEARDMARRGVRWMETMSFETIAGSFR